MESPDAESPDVELSDAESPDAESLNMPSFLDIGEIADRFPGEESSPLCAGATKMRDAFALVSIARASSRKMVFAVPERFNSDADVFSNRANKRRFVSDDDAPLWSFDSFWRGGVESGALCPERLPLEGIPLGKIALGRTLRVLGATGGATRCSKVGDEVESSGAGSGAEERADESSADDALLSAAGAVSARCVFCGAALGRVLDVAFFGDV